MYYKESQSLAIVYSNYYCSTKCNTALISQNKGKKHGSGKTSAGKKWVSKHTN